MARKTFSAEQIVAKLRAIEVQLAQGKSIALACKDAGISEQSYYRWRKEYGGLQIEQAKRLKDLERENARLRRLVADLSLEKQILKEVASGNL
jgi:putative transposase